MSEVIGSFRGGIGRVAGVLLNGAGVALGLRTADQARAQFIANVLALTGDTRLFWLPASTDTTASTGQSLNGQTITWNATIAAQLSAQGLGYGVSFDGSTDFATIADNDNLSFGTGAADSAFSIVAVLNVTDTAARRCILAKFTTNQREWLFEVNASDLLSVSLFDESNDNQPIRASTAAVTMGSIRTFGMTYSAATGGATAANDITLYTQGVVKASSATNAASYVAMENGTSTVLLGAQTSSPANTFQGTGYLVLLCQKALTASDHYALHKLFQGYFGY